jgi:acetyl-CoA carboxylase biotin carboxylase subunit
MNTRLQVEHPVTELVTGFDLVREQINVAAGRPLSFTQEDVRWNGHAIECRVYAEDPQNNFFPSPGRITFLRVPSGPGLRDDSGVAEGDEVSIFYDPMISKLAAWGRTRAEAIDRLRRALDEYAVGGIKTTLPFFRSIVRDEEFIAARLDTGFIPRFNQRKGDEPVVDPQAFNLESDIAVVAAVLAYAQAQRPAANNHYQPQSKWKMAGRAEAVRSTVPERK